MESIGDWWLRKELEFFTKYLNQRIDELMGVDPNNTVPTSGPHPNPFNPYGMPTTTNGPQVQATPKAIQAYYGFPPVVPDPDPAPVKSEPKLEDVKTKLDLQKYYEYKIEKALDEMPDAMRAMLYKHMYIGGLRIGDCEPKIHKGLDEEFKKLKK